MRTLKRSVKRQHGAAALAVTMLLLFGSTIVVFYLNRGLIFEQKASANQVRSTSAQEVAEAGIEWATGMMNTPYDLGTNCNLLATTNVSFRRKYVQTNSATNAVAAATNVYPGCMLSATALTCSCPDVPSTGEAVASVSNPPTLPSFTLAFANVAGDTEAVQVTSTGCTSQANFCKPLTAGSAATTGTADATATISVILKMRKLIRAAPASPMTCGTTCTLSGSFSVQNFDASTNGITVNAGSTTAGTSSRVSTIPGLPADASVIPNDPSLSALASNDTSCTSSKMFQAYFGSTIQEFAASPETNTITCTTANDCGYQLNKAMIDGWRSYYFPSGLALNSSAPFTQLGSGAPNYDPVTLVTPGSISINATMNIYGMLFSNDATTGDIGTGGSNIYGALVACAGFKSNGNGNVLYDPNVLQNLQRSTSVMVRVPGSWKDF